MSKKSASKSEKGGREGGRKEGGREGPREGCKKGGNGHEWDEGEGGKWNGGQRVSE